MWNNLHLIVRYIRDQCRVNHSPPPPKFLPKQRKSSFEAAPKFAQLFHQRWNSSQVWRGAWFGRKFETGRAQKPRVPRFSPLTRQIWYAQLRHSCVCARIQRTDYGAAIARKLFGLDCSAENKRAKRNHHHPSPFFPLLLFYSRATDARFILCHGKIVRGNDDRPRFREFVAGN